MFVSLCFMRVVLALAWHQPLLVAQVAVQSCGRLIYSAKIQKKLNNLPIVIEILYNLIVVE